MTLGDCVLTRDHQVVFAQCLRHVSSNLWKRWFEAKYHPSPKEMRYETAYCPSAYDKTSFHSLSTSSTRKPKTPTNLHFVNKINERHFHCFVLQTYAPIQRTLKSTVQGFQLPPCYETCLENTSIPGRLDISFFPVGAGRGGGVILLY